MSRFDSFWRAIAAGLGAGLALYAVGYLPRGDSSAGPVYDVIRHQGGVRLHSVLMVAAAVGLLISSWTRAALLGAVVLVMFCGWSVSALFLGYRSAGTGWGAWVAFAVFGFIATCLVVWSPSYAYVPWHRWARPRSQR